MSSMYRIVRRAVFALAVGATAVAGYLGVAGGNGHVAADPEPTVSVVAAAAAEDIGWA